MNKQLLIITTSSICCGFCYGTLVGSKLMEKYYAKLSEKEIKEAREYYKRKNSEIELFKKGKEAVKDLNEASNKIITERGLKDIGNVVPDEYQKFCELNNLYKPNTVFDEDPFKDILDEKEEDDTEDNIIEVESDALSDNSSEPYVITEEEFSSECLHYDKISATYFADGTLTDEDENIIDISSSIGFDALDAFTYTDGKEPIYVRNENLSIDYIVTQNSLSYSEYILGIDPDDSDRSEPKKRSKNEWTE